MCVACHKPIRNNVFHLEDGDPYCETGEHNYSDPERRQAGDIKKCSCFFISVYFDFVDVSSPCIDLCLLVYALK